MTRELTFRPFRDALGRRTPATNVEPPNEPRPPARRRELLGRDLETDMPPSARRRIERERHRAAVAFFKRAIRNQIRSRSK